MDDYGALIQSGYNILPDVAEQIQRQRGLNAQTAALGAETQQRQQETQAAAAKLSRLQMFQHDIQSYDGTPASASKLIMKYPEYGDQLKEGQDLGDKAKTQSDLTSTAEIYSAALGGNWDLAKKLAHARADAERAAGHSDPAYDEALKVLDTAADGDPTQRKVVLNLLGAHLAAVTGPEHFSAAYDAVGGGDYTLDAGAARFHGGEMTAHSPFIKDADGAIRLWTDATNPPSETAAPASGGADNAIAHVLSNEGGYNPKDMNGAPVNYGINAKANAAELKKLGVKNIKDLTEAQAIQIYKDKYWKGSGAENLPANLQAPYFDVYVRNEWVARNARAQSGGDPAKFMALASAYFQNLAQKPSGAPYGKAWANRDAKNLAIATGQAPPEVAAPAAAAQQAAANQFPVVIPGKPKEAPAGYRYKADGTTLEPIPGGPADKAGADDILSKYNIAQNETGPSVLMKLPASLATQVKALAEGRLPMPSSFALAKPYWQTLLQLTGQYDPSFDASAYQARKSAITAFTGNGKAAQVVGSVNRVANHLNLLWNESNKLAGPDTGFGPLNSMLATARQAFQPDDAKAYDAEVGFVAGELEKIARNSPGTESGVERVIANLGRHNSLKTRQAAIKAAVGIISGAVDPLKDQYNSAFTNGSARPNIPWVSPKAQQIYKNIGGVDMSLTGAGADTNSPAGDSGGVVRIQTAEQWHALKPGTHYIDPTGVQRIKH